ncbi:TetR/AcrR family transcriptional regulator [Mycobacteroides abscessus]|uniref:TetR/AcrR family transcriptional regulator n=1 Tax=Mycobacteroides abscessus TaxID=36809 RepID=UPI0013F65AE9|nr:TetR/AcrR family transcriptional regulator [Mycobacteroides abscessus]
MVAGRGYNGIPAEERRSERRTRLLDAALNVVGAHGYSRLSASGLCQMTGLNDRYFYEHFTDRDAIFDALVDQLAGQTLAAMGEAIADAGTDPEQVARAGLTACIDLLTGDPRKARVVFVEAPAHSSRSHRTRVRDLFIGLMRGQAESKLGGALSDELDSKITFAGIHLFGALMECTTSWLAGDLTMDKTELIDQSVDLLLTISNHVLPATQPVKAPT